MFTVEFLLKLLNQNKVSQYIYTILLISLITVFDFFTLFIFSKMIGLFLYLAIICSLTILGILFLVRYIKKTLNDLESKHSKNIYPEIEFYHITTLFFSSAFIIFPGIISSLLGITIAIIPPIRVLIGRKLSKALKLDWNAVYEYKEIYSN